MSNVLPRSQKELHFTGSMKALAPERPGSTLGQERPKAPPPPVPERSQRSLAPARPGPAPATPAARPVKLMTMRGQLASIDDELLTQSLDRAEIDAALFPIARRANASEPAPSLPVPHFRSAAEAAVHHAQPVIIHAKPAAAGSFPLGAWLLAALLAGIVSYQLAPQAALGVAQAVRSLDSR